MTDAIPKDDMGSMEHPILLAGHEAGHPASGEYEHNGDRWVEVVPSVKGLATIYDKDILIYCISQLIAKMNAGDPPSPYVRIVAKDLLVFANRIGRRQGLRAAGRSPRPPGRHPHPHQHQDRRRAGSHEGLRPDRIVQSSADPTRPAACLEIASSCRIGCSARSSAGGADPAPRLFPAAASRIERRVYEMARKHCGKQDSWKISLELLKLKCGSRAPLKGFRHDIKQLAKGDHLPDYCVSVDDEDFVTFQNRSAIKALPSPTRCRFPKLDAETYHDARHGRPGLRSCISSNGNGNAGGAKAADPCCTTRTKPSFRSARAATKGSRILSNPENRAFWISSFSSNRDFVKVRFLSSERYFLQSF